MAETRLTDEQIGRLERLDREATAAPWFASRNTGLHSIWYELIDGNDRELLESGVTLEWVHPNGHEAAKADDAQRTTDLNLAAEARNALPALLREIRERRAAERENEPQDWRWEILEAAGWQRWGWGWGRQGIETQCVSTEEAYRRLKGL